MSNNIKSMKEHFSKLSINLRENEEVTDLLNSLRNINVRSDPEDILVAEDVGEIDEDFLTNVEKGFEGFVFDEDATTGKEFDKYNKKIIVNDNIADYVSENLCITLRDYPGDIPDLVNLEFNSNLENINSIFSKNVKVIQGRMKNDFFLPFPSSKRSDISITEADIYQAFPKVSYCLSSKSDQINQILKSDLIEYGLMNEDKYTTKEGDKTALGSFALKSIRNIFEEISEIFIGKDEVSSNIDYLYENYSTGNSLYEHEKKCIEQYKRVFDVIKETRLSNYTLLLERLSQIILHESSKIKSNKVLIRHTGDSRIILLMTRSQMRSVEDGPMCSFIIKMTRNDYESYIKAFKLKILFENDREELYIQVPWRSFDTNHCLIMSKANYHLYTYSLLLVDDFYSNKVVMNNFLKLMTGLIQCRNTEVFNVLSVFRYILPGLFNKYHNIPELIMDKFPCNVSSPFNDYIIDEFLIWIELHGNEYSHIDRTSDEVDVDDLENYEVQFNAYLPFLNVQTTSFQKYLTIIYLVSSTIGKTSKEKHTILKLCNTIEEWQNKFISSPELFNFDNSVIKEASEYLKERCQEVQLKTSDGISKFLRTKGTYDESKTFMKLYDRVLDELRSTNRELTVNDVLEDYDLSPKMRLAVRDDHAGQREVFVTTYQNVVALNTIETLAHDYCTQISSEHITLGGEKKFCKMQKEARNSIRDKKTGWINNIGSEDASKWSTGDNVEILSTIFSTLSDSSLISQKLERFILSMKSREIYFPETHKEYLNKRLMKNDFIFTNIGWPQGFFNKLSSIKHYLCYCYSIALFKRLYDGNERVKINFAVHSDDSRHRISVETDNTLISNKVYAFYLKCLFTAKKKFLIRPNFKKSFYSGVCSEYLSNYQFFGSLFVPVSKFCLNIFGDLAAIGYAGDLYIVLERVREVMRLNGGMIMGTFLMKYSSHYIRKLYSLLPGMDMYDHLRCTKNNLIEFGGIYSVHPLLLLFMGSKAHDVLNYDENKEKIMSLAKYAETNNDNIDTDKFQKFDHFLTVPEQRISVKSRVEKVQRSDDCTQLLDDEKWKTLYILDLPSSESRKVAESLLYTSSMFKAYSNMPEGVIHSMIQKNCKKNNYLHNGLKLNFWDHVKHLETLNGEERDIINTMIKGSPVLKSILNLLKSEIRVEDIGSKEVYSSQINEINIISPGNMNLNHIKYSFAKMFNLEINYPEYLADDIVDREIYEISKIMTGYSSYFKDRKNIPFLFKMLQIKTPKDIYIHMDYPIRKGQAINVYSIVSGLLSTYGPGYYGNVQIGKIKNVYINDKTYIPQSITNKIEKYDEIHTIAKIISLLRTGNERKITSTEINDKVKIGDNDITTLLKEHPYTGGSMSYYLDYMYVTSIFKDESYLYVPSIKYQYREDEKMYIFKFKSEILYVNSNDEMFIDLTEKGEYDKCTLLAFGYWFIDFKRDNNLFEGKAKNDKVIPGVFIARCPYLYFEFEQAYKNDPSPSFDFNTLIYKTGFSKKYLKNVYSTLSEFLNYDLSESRFKNFDYHKSLNIREKIQHTDGVVLSHSLVINDSFIHDIGGLAELSVNLKVKDMEYKNMNMKDLLSSGFFKKVSYLENSKHILIPDPMSVDPRVRSITRDMIPSIKDINCIKVFMSIIENMENISKARKRKFSNEISFDVSKTKKSIYDLREDYSNVKVDFHRVLTPLVISRLYSYMVKTICPVRDWNVLAEYSRFCRDYILKPDELKDYQYSWYIDLFIVNVSTLLQPFLRTDMERPEHTDMQKVTMLPFFAGLSRECWGSVYTLWSLWREKEDEKTKQQESYEKVQGKSWFDY